MTTPAATSIVYPESDGMPLPDGEYQAPLYRRVVGRLDVHFGGVPGVRVNGDTFIYYVEGNPRRSVSPDCYVVFGLSDAAAAACCVLPFISFCLINTTCRSVSNIPPPGG